jgi:mRNA interferase MazF
MRRGEVRWVDFEYSDKRWPAVILTSKSAIGYLSTVTVAPITTTIRHTPSALRLGPEDGLPFDCAANLHNVQSVTQSRIGALIAVLAESKLAQVEAALLSALGMERYARQRRTEDRQGQVIRIATG